jgi:hypothetical protein
MKPLHTRYLEDIKKVVGDKNITTNSAVRNPDADNYEMIHRDQVQEWIETAYHKGEKDQRQWWVDRIKTEVKKIEKRKYPYNRLYIEEVVEMLENLLPGKEEKA